MDTILLDGNAFCAQPQETLALWTEFLKMKFSSRISTGEVKMSNKHFLISLGAGMLVLTMFGILTTAPTFAAAGMPTQRMFDQNAPPAQGPTLVPQTADPIGIPPIDLGPLNAETTPIPTATTAPQGATNVVVENTFDECEPIEDDYLLIECKDGQMNFTRKETRGTRYIYYRPNLTDALIEVTGRLPSQKNARYGVIFRLDDEFKNYYILGVTNEGKYGLFRYAEDHYETIIPYTDDVNVGNASFPTKIKIVNQGDVIAINLGGQWVASIRDPNLKAGRVALFTEPDEPNQTILFDDLKISEILSPLEVPEPRTVEPAATPTTAGSDLPVFNFDATPTAAAVPPTSAPQPTQTPFIIVVTATPQPTAVAPTRAPTHRPTQAACDASANEALLYISNNYSGTTMRFTIGGGEWGTHDYDVPGDGKWYSIRMPPGNYTYTAHIAGVGKASGEKTEYARGQCYQLRFSP